MDFHHFQRNYDATSTTTTTILQQRTHHDTILLQPTITPTLQLFSLPAYRCRNITRAVQHDHDTGKPTRRLHHTVIVPQQNIARKETTRSPINPTTNSKSVTAYKYSTNTSTQKRTLTTGASLAQSKESHRTTATSLPKYSEITKYTKGQPTKNTGNTSIQLYYRHSTYDLHTTATTYVLLRIYNKKLQKRTPRHNLSDHFTEHSLTMSKPPPKSPKLPATSRYPALVSGQFRYTTEDAAKSLDSAPGYVYRIQIDMKAPQGTNFNTVPWTLTARRFFAALQGTDPNALILTRRKESTANKITGHEEIPESSSLFERDYAYDVKIEKSRATYKVIVATSDSFFQTFKTGSMFRKMQQNTWFVTMIRIQTQGHTVAIGHLCGGHNRFSHQETLIREINQLIAPKKCEDIDIIVTKPGRTYIEKDSEGKEKKQRIHTRWPTIFCPVDVANDLTTLLLERWGTLTSDPSLSHLNIQKMTLIPANRNLLPVSTFIKYMADQNEFLHGHKDVTVIYNCHNMDKPFLCTTEMASNLSCPAFSEKKITLREILLSWKDLKTQFDDPVIRSIDKSYEEGSYSVLSHNRYTKDVRRDIENLVSLLSRNLHFASLSTGGTVGTRRFKHGLTTISDSYVKSLGTYDDRFGQKAPTSPQQASTVDTSDSSFTSPPPPPRPRRMAKQGSCPNTIDLTHPHTRLFRDVLKDTSSASVSQTSSLTTIEDSSSTSASLQQVSQQKARSTTFQSGGLVTFKQYMASDEFKDCLASIVAPQVSSIIQPTLTQISTIENEVKDINSFISTQHEAQQRQRHEQETTNRDISAIRGDMTRLLSLLTPATAPLTQASTGDSDVHSHCHNNDRNEYETPTKFAKLDNGLHGTASPSQSYSEYNDHSHSKHNPHEPGRQGGSPFPATPTRHGEDHAMNEADPTISRLRGGELP